MNNREYVKEMSESGYSPENVDDFHTTAVPYIVGALLPDKNSCILDLGVGAGHVVLSLKSAGYSKLFAADIDDFYADFFEKQGIVFKKANLEKDTLDFKENYFDAITSFHVVEHLSDPSNFMSECKRLLKPGGRLVMVTPDWRKQYKTFWRDHTHVHPYDKESIQRLFRAGGFEVETVRSFGVLRGVGRLKLWKLFPALMFTGLDMVCIGKK